MKDGKPVEVTTVGHEGLFGGVRLFFDDDEAFARAICDVSGHVQKIASDVFWALVKALPGLRHVVHHYTHAAFMETAQSVACSKAHTLPQRFARTMLTKQDRARTQTLPMTGGQVAEMLSISPPGASDNGRGFRTRAAESFGVRGMEERARTFGAELIVESTPTDGTILSQRTRNRAS